MNYLISLIITILIFFSNLSFANENKIIFKINNKIYSELDFRYRINYLEEINGERIVAINLAENVLEANDNWDNKTITYQEAKQEFDKFIQDWANFVETVTTPGPPSEYPYLVTSHAEIVTLVNLIYEDTIELKAGLESSDTGEQRSAALDSFNNHINQLTEKINEVVITASS